MMGPGFASGIASTIGGFLILAAVLIFLAGMGTVAGCNWLVARYDVSISVEQQK